MSTLFVLVVRKRTIYSQFYFIFVFEILFFFSSLVSFTLPSLSCDVSLEKYFCSVVCQTFLLLFLFFSIGPDNWNVKIAYCLHFKLNFFVSYIFFFSLSIVCIKSKLEIQHFHLSLYLSSMCRLNQILFCTYMDDIWCWEFYKTNKTTRNPKLQ